jgi:hypothetical protein
MWSLWGTGGPIWGPVSGYKATQMPKKWTQGDGATWQKLAAALGQLDHHPIHSLHKGYRDREHGKTTGNGIRGQNRNQELCLGRKKTLGPQTNSQDGGHEESSQVFHWVAESDWALWRSQFPPKQKKRHQKASPCKRQ